MALQYPKHPLTKIVIRLKDDQHWKRAMKYRNTWVHEKPPILEGLGREYNRQNKIFSDENAKGFGIGSWSMPDFKIDEVVALAHQSTDICIEVLTELLELVKEKRKELGTPVL